ncbi:MAG: phosphatidylserine decarboxylase [Candidatus Bruticola sp.]
MVKIIKSLHDGDELYITDSISTQISSLKDNLKTEPSYQARISQIHFEDKFIWELDKPEYFNSIILSYPIDLLSDDILKKSMESCRSLLIQGGTVSCLEIAWLRKVRSFLTSCWRKNSCQPIQPTCLERFINSFLVYKETIVTNIPPVWVNHLRFTPSSCQDAAKIHAIEGRSSLALGPIKIAKDFLRFVLPLGTLSWGLKKFGCALWYWPMILLAGVAAFLRDPRRTIKADRNLAFSACDGKVLDVSIVTDPHLGTGQWLRIATFLSLFDTHINRSPVSGKIVDQFDVEGGYARANLPKANHNYSTYVLLETEHGTIAIAQRVGLIARRIYNWVGRGELLAQGERYGLIRMGSRTDVYLPCDKYRSLVKVGDKIQAGLTPIAALVPEETNHTEDKA